MLMTTDDSVRPAAAWADTQVVRVLVYGSLILVDLLIVLAAFTLTDLFRHDGLFDLASASYLLILPAFLSVNFYVGGYTYGTVVSRARSISKAITAMLASSALTIVLIFALKNSGDISRLAFFSGTLLSIAGLAAVGGPPPPRRTPPAAPGG